MPVPLPVPVVSKEVYSYEWGEDEGKSLETILTAPMVVAETLLARFALCKEIAAT